MGGLRGLGRGGRNSGGGGAELMGSKGKSRGREKRAWKTGTPRERRSGLQGGFQGKIQGGKKGAWTAGTSWERGSGSREEIRVSSSGNGPPSPEP